MPRTNQTQTATSKTTTKKKPSYVRKIRTNGSTITSDNTKIKSSPRTNRANGVTKKKIIKTPRKQQQKRKEKNVDRLNEEIAIESTPVVETTCVVLPDRHEARCLRLEEISRKKAQKEGEKNKDSTGKKERSQPVLIKRRKIQSQIIKYNPEDYTKLVNVFNGASGEGFCYKFGVIRKGKPFMKKLSDISRAFLMEIVYKTVLLCATKGKSIISSDMVNTAVQTFNIHTVI